MSIEMNNKIVALQIAVEQIQAEIREQKQVMGALTSTVEKLNQAKDVDYGKGLRVRTVSRTAGQGKQNKQASKAPF